jgi:hypothetical protein
MYKIEIKRDIRKFKLVGEARVSTLKAFER